jgi:hypothetical protein
MVTTPSKQHKLIKIMCILCHSKCNLCHPCHSKYIRYPRMMPMPMPRPMAMVPSEDPTPNVASYNLSIDLQRKLPFAGQNRVIRYWILFLRMNFGSTIDPTASKALWIVLPEDYQHIECVQIVERHFTIKRTNLLSTISAL